MPTNKQRAAGVAGATAFAIAIITPFVMDFEGRRFVPYQDIAGIWTVCDGDTEDVVPRQVATPAECDARLNRQLVAHAEPVRACVPALEWHPYQFAASVSLAYNIGTAAFCRSTAARRFNAGDWRGGCDAFLMWNKVKGRVIRGLDNRRKRERQLCLRGMA